MKDSSDVLTDLADMQADIAAEDEDDLCYHGGQSWDTSRFDFEVRDSLIVADVLDSPFPPCPEALDVLREQLIRCCQESPPTQCEELIETIASVRGVNAKHVAVSSGSSSLMFSFLPQLLNKDSKVLVLSPMYGEYSHILTHVIGCHMTNFILHQDDGFRINTDELVAQSRQHDAVILVNPNSPTGVYCEKMEDIVRRIQDESESPTLCKMIWVDETYIDYLIEWLEFIGPDAGGRGAHMLAVCQPSVPAYAAAAVMSAKDHPLRPRTLTMMGGPIDTREAPTAVNDHATRRPHEWFVQNVIATVPPYYKGSGRRVYPGFLQLTGFMSMNLGNHMISHWSMFSDLVKGDGESADRHKEFYDEYRSVCDMTAEFYLQTVDTVFQRHLLPKGEFNYRGKLVDPGAITDIGLLAIEGERDDISGLGQTKAALNIATALPDALKKYHMAPEVGHYGIFNGSKWREKIAPVVEDWIVSHNG